MPALRRSAANISSCMNGRRSHRAPGHEREDAFAYLRELGGTAFAKPLFGDRAAILPKSLAARRCLRDIWTRFRDTTIRY